jgi:predicted nucleotidyltransferase component of viral defense system
MSEYEKYYMESLYPFQDGILAIVKSINAPFYLTGGTALSRYYRSVRYSDDLDLFVNNRSDFSTWIERLYAELEKRSQRDDFTVLTDRVLKFENYVQFFIQRGLPDGQIIDLKIDLVNDVAPHYGSIEWDDTLGRIDSWRNILSNKISALFRVEAKDVVDLWSMAKSYSFIWSEIIEEASSKEAGIDPVALYDLLKSFPSEQLSNIKWTETRPEETVFMTELNAMAEDLFEGRENSLTI